jgi:mRNA interferase RelE/StbE
VKYKVIFSDAAFKQIKKLDAFQRKVITGWIRKNLESTDDPRIQGKGLTENLSGYWRYRIGDFRIICKIHDDVCEIIVIQVGHRSKIYS